VINCQFYIGLVAEPVTYADAPVQERGLVVVKPRRVPIAAADSHGAAIAVGGFPYVNRRIHGLRLGL